MLQMKMHTIESDVNRKIELVASANVVKTVHVNRLILVSQIDVSDLRPTRTQGTIVFAKVVVGHPFCPAKICRFSDLPARVAHRDLDKIPVQFFGVKPIFGVCEPENVLYFAENLHKYKLCQRKGYQRALELA